MALSDDVADLLVTVRRVVQELEGLKAKAEETERAAGSRIGAPPRMTRTA